MFEIEANYKFVIEDNSNIIIQGNGSFVFKFSSRSIKVENIFTAFGKELKKFSRIEIEIQFLILHFVV